MDNVARRMVWSRGDAGDAAPLLGREWLVTNGLGGYASGTIAGILTRRYHGLLIAALPAPLGRTVMLSQLCERLWFPDGTVARLGGEERSESDLEVPATSLSQRIPSRGWAARLEL